MFGQNAGFVASFETLEQLPENIVERMVRTQASLIVPPMQPKGDSNLFLPFTSISIQNTSLIFTLVV
jgi:hypothetical protein